MVVNGTNLPSGPSHIIRNKKVGAIVGGIIGGVAAVFAVIGIVIFVRRNKPTNTIQADPMVVVTPFVQDCLEAAQDTGITTDQRPSAAEEAGAERPILLPISRPMRPPVGFSAKELARLRSLAEIPTSQQPVNRQGLTSSVPRHTSSLTVAEIGGAALPFETQRQLVHSSEIESLLERLRAGGIVFAAPPSYDTWGGSMVY